MVNQSLYKRGRSPDAAGSTRTSLLRRSFRWCPWFAKILWRTKFPSRLGFKLFETSFYRGYNLLLERLVDKFQPKQSFKLWTTCLFQILKLCQTIVKRPPIYHISYSHIGFLSGIPESFMDLFGKMNFGEECKQWDSEADLVRVVQYVRGSKKLNIPREWRELIPKTIPI